jgi:Big-like domain-containing protein
MVLGCSNLTEGAGGVVELEIRTPVIPTLEVGEALQLSARALDKNGDSVAADITWRTPDPTVTVDPQTGVITGVSAGTGRVQAFAGTLASSLVTFNVVTPPDILILVGDSVVTVGPLVPASAPLVVQLQSLSLPGPIASWPVIYAVTSPPDVEPHTVALPNGAFADTLVTGTDGAVSSATLNRVNGTTQPDTAIVEVRAFHTRGGAIPGSGQRFLVIFQ